MDAPQHAELAPLDLLANALNLHAVPFTERGARILVMRGPAGEGPAVFLAELSRKSKVQVLLSIKVDRRTE